MKDFPITVLIVLFFGFFMIVVGYPASVSDGAALARVPHVDNMLGSFLLFGIGIGMLMGRISK